MNTNKTKELLTGVWEVVGFFRREGSKKYPIKLYKSGDYYFGFPVEGIITERHGNRVSSNMYTFDAENNILSIIPTDCDPANISSPISGREDPVYRVIRLDDKEMRLLRPHTVESEDADSLFELFILRRPQ